ncbi:TP901 family phage tail tape measure protein [Nocardiopsis sp. Huas11]|uniref:phage tail tape measure protein n=1 Tax=Nocardiopsis sp. Huas11 TaxID=2183912 RepID=UPI000EAC106D|nr:phage tail tape measure protein [Nocardiopsis sp. Huas11]RKS10034.1 TP901 family phage tail tape measure protein [Nocardiopsis sp. Huas11]
MSILEELTVVLDANTRPFDRETRRMERRVRRTFAGVERTATRAGRTGGTGFVTGFDTTTNRGLRRSNARVVNSMTSVEKTMAASGTRAGTGFATSMGQATTQQVSRSTTQLTRTMGGVEKTVAASGTRAGTGFATGMTTAATKTLGGSATQGELAGSGILAAQGWVRGVDGKIRDSRGKFVSAANQAAAGLAVGVRQQATKASGPVATAMTEAGATGGRSFTRGLSGGLAGIGTAFGAAGAVAGVAALAIGGAAINAAGNFEYAMNGVRAVTGATGQSFEALESQAKELGATTQFSATEAANAMEFLGMAGFDASQTMAALPNVLNLAAAGNTDLARTADIASNVMSGFGLKAEESGRIADVLAQTMRSTNVDLNMLGESFKYAAPLASAAGWSFEETAAAIGFLGNAGIQGSMAGTGLNSILATLADTSSTGSKKLKEFGVAATGADGQVRPLTGLLTDLADKGADVGDVMSIFGLEAGPKLQSLLGQGSAGIEALIADLENSEGAAQEMADIRMEGFVGGMKGARSAVEGFFISFADLGILDAATQAVGMFTGGVRAVTGWLDKHERIVTPVIKAVGMFASIVAVLVGGLLLAKGAMLGVGAALGVLGGPVVWVIAGVAALATGLVIAYKRSEKFRSIVTGAWEGIQAAASTAKRFFDRNIWPGLVWGWEQLEDVAGRVGRWFATTLWPALVDGWREFRNAAQPHAERILRWLRNLRDGADEFRDRWGFLWDQAAARVRIATDLIGSVAGNMVRQLGGWIDIVTGLMSGDWSKVWSGAKTVMKSGFDNLVAVGTAGVKLLWQTLKLQFVQLPRAIAEWIVEDLPVIERRLRTEWIPAFLGWVVDLEARLRSKLVGLLRRFGSWLATDAPDMIRDKTAEWTKRFTTWAGGLWPAIKAELPGAVASLGSWISDQKSELDTKLDGWTESFKEWAGGLWESGKEQFNAYGQRFTEWAEAFAESLPDRLKAWTDRIVAWIDGVSESLPDRLEDWTKRFTTWINEFAESLPDRLQALTDRFVAWATNAPTETAEGFEKADGGGQIARQVEEDWAPRLLMAFVHAIASLVVAIPGMVARVGWALISGFHDVLVQLGVTVAESFVRLGKAAARQWREIKDAILGIASDLVKGVADHINEMVDNTIGAVEGLGDVLIFNSIVPDMVSEIIAETGKLPGGVGGEFDLMGAEAAKKATSMQVAMVSEMATMVSQVMVALVKMQASATGVFTSLVASLVRALGVLVSSATRLVATLGKNIAGGFASMAKNSATAFATMVRGLITVAGTLSRTLTSVFADMHKKTVTGFARTVKGVATAWSGLRQAVAAPVRYVISPVVNRGLRGVWNTIASKVPGLGSMPAVKGFDRGGLVDLTNGGSLSGFSVRDNRLAMVRDGEAVLTPAATRGLGGEAFVDAANQAGTGASRLLQGVPGFAGGGVVGLADSFNAKAKNDFDNKGGAVAAGQQALGGMTDIVGNRFGRGTDLPGAAGYRQMMVWQAAILSQIKKNKDDLEVGKGAKGVVKLAEKSVGRYPEVPGGSNRNAITDWYGMVGPWCAMFISWLYNQTKQSQALKGASRSAWTGDYYTSGMKRVNQPRPADIQVFGTDHVRMVTDKSWMGVGGNEGDNVRKGRRFGGALFRPQFARGGVIENRDFWNQDKGWEGPFPGEHTQRMRDIWNGAQTYDQGGWLAPGYTLAYNDTGAPEPIGAEPIVVTIDLRGDDEDMVRRLRKQVKIKGGGSVQVALGKGTG